MVNFGIATFPKNTSAHLACPAIPNKGAFPNASPCTRPIEFSVCNACLVVGHASLRPLGGSVDGRAVGHQATSCGIAWMLSCPFAKGMSSVVFQRL
jgi:hypothetical protein